MTSFTDNHYVEATSIHLSEKKANLWMWLFVRERGCKKSIIKEQQIGCRENMLFTNEEKKICFSLWNKFFQHFFRVTNVIKRFLVKWTKNFYFWIECYNNASEFFLCCNSGNHKKVLFRNASNRWKNILLMQKKHFRIKSSNVFPMRPMQF